VIRKSYAWLWLAAMGPAGCLLTVTPEPGFIDTGTCDPEACPDNLTCIEGQGCASYCLDDSQCRDDFVCAGGACVTPCEPRSCGLYACDEVTEECRTSCDGPSDCKPDAACVEGSCVEPCLVEDCGGFRCDLTETCLETCEDDGDCWSSGDYLCCSDPRVAAGLCREGQLGSCVR
jgi:hypothetical protein